METSLQKNTGAIGRATVPLRMLRDYGGLQGARFFGGQAVRQGDLLHTGSFWWGKNPNSPLPFAFQLIHTLHHHITSGELRLFHQRDDFTVLYVGQRVFQQCRGRF